MEYSGLLAFNEIPNGIYNKDVMGKSIPSGKLTDSELENHHF
jgi:hypothetical protein